MPPLAPPATRRHDIDALRALAFALLIVYHWAMLYVFDWGWHVKSSYQSEAWQWPMLFVNRWRMDLIFMISGMASAFLLKPDAVLRFAGQRTWRLFLPLVVGMLVIVPIQPYAQGVSNGLVEPGFWRFYVDYVTKAHPWPAGAFDGWEDSMTWNHLWYLAYLWIYTLALAVIAKPLASPAGRRLTGLFTGLRGWKLMVLPAVPILAYTLTLQERFPDRGDFVHDWYRNAVYFTMFVYGYLLARNDGFWAEAGRLRKNALVVALALFAVYISWVAIAPDDVSAWQQHGIWTLRVGYIWTALLAILGWSHVLLNRPFRWLPWANESVYPWYILHQSLIVGLAFWLVPMKLGAITEGALILGGTIAGCALGSEAIKRVPWLRPLFGLKYRSREPDAHAPAVLGDNRAPG